MNVGFVPNPRDWSRWNEAKALLDPARKMGGFNDVLEGDEILFAALDGDDLLGVATAWLSKRGYVEVKLVGGRDYRRWIGELDEVIGAAAAEAGATQLLALGRRGWTKQLTRQGWVQHSVDDGMTAYTRELGD